MKSITVLALGLMFTGCLASAQELTKQAKIERLLTLTHAEAMMDQAFNQMKGAMASQVPTGATPDNRRERRSSKPRSRR